MTEDEKRDLMNAIHERIGRYLRLGFTIRECTKELMFDDRLWEEAQKLPIDRNNWVDRANRARSKEELIEIMREELNKEP